MEVGGGLERFYWTSIREAVLPCEAVLHGCETNLLCLFDATVIVFQLYRGGDMYEMRRRKPEPTFVPTPTPTQA